MTGSNRKSSSGQKVRRIGIIAAFFVFIGGLALIPSQTPKTENEDREPTETMVAVEEVEPTEHIPPYDDSPYVTVNDNVPCFTQEEKAAAVSSYENYSPLDELGRCGVCMASVGPDLMPTEERGAIGSVRPSGWHTVKYPGIIADNYLYNRCHLLAYQLTGENANEQNLITGTRYMNMEGMAPFENRVAEYVKSTGNHVLYRVTPVFEGDNLLASGVRMEAWSVEDEGAGVSFHVYCYNVQPGIRIDYADGSSEAQENAVTEGSAAVHEAVETGAFAVNSKNGKIHKTGECPATGDGAQAMSSPVYFSTYQEAEAFSEQIAPGLSERTCGNCW